MSLAVFVLAACASDPVAEGDGDDGKADGDDGDGGSVSSLAFNDVSILLHVPTAAERRRARFATWLPAIAPKLITQENLELLLFHGAASPNLVDLQDEYVEFLDAEWRVVSARLDPRFLQQLPDAPGTPGLGVLRLVAQPFHPDGTMADGAFHLIYRVDPAVVAAALVELKKTSSVSTATRFGVHPGHRRDWETGDTRFSTALNELITRFCTPTNLISINLAVSVIDANDDVSTFYAAFLRNAQARFTAISPPALADQPSLHQVAIRNADAGESIIFPLARVADQLLDDLDAMLYPDLHDPSAAVAESMLARAYRIESPNLHTLSSTDCISCHLSTPVLDSALAQLDDDAVARAAASEYQLLRADQQPSERKSDPTSFRNFGYEPTAGGNVEIAISQRTVNETDRTLPLVQRLLAD